MERSIYKYIFRYSARQQVVLTVLAALSLPFLYLYYQLQKKIVNHLQTAVDGQTPISEARAWDLFGLEVTSGVVAFLLILCGIFLALILANQAFKYYINVFRGLTGERMLRRLRYDLYSRVLRFPLPTFKRTGQGEIIPMITSEVEPLGGFFGESLSLPAFQGGQLLVMLSFLLIQNWVMALAAVALYPLQMYLIPKLQRRVNLLGKQRVQLVRQLSQRIGESVQGVQEVHAHDTSNFERADFTRRLGDIFWVRYDIYRKKFFIKFLNNFINQLGPLAFYSIGGYLVLTNQLDFGALVAAISAHKDLAAPWKELLGYYQRREDARIKYEQVISQFEPTGMRDADDQQVEPETMPSLDGPVRANNLQLVDDQDQNVVEATSFRLPAPQRVAVIGGSGRGDLAQLLARLIDPTKGSINYGDLSLEALPETVVGRRAAFVGHAGFVFATTIGENLYYGLKHRPLGPVDYTGDAAKQRKERLQEALAAGNSADDPAADWTDYAAAGANNGQDLLGAGLSALRLVELDEDVYGFGLRGVIDPDADSALAEAILTARGALRTRFADDPSLAPLVEGFDIDQYNTNATIAENLLFGTPIGDGIDIDRLAENDYVLKILDRVGLTGQMVSMGFQVASTMVELFGDLPADHEFFQQFSFMSADDLTVFQALLNRVDRNQLDDTQGDDRTLLLSLPFRLIPARHRLGLVSEDVQSRILEARRAFAADLPAELQGRIEFFDRDRYIAAATLQDNILFGKMAYGQAKAAERVGEEIRAVVEELGLREKVIEAGLGFEVGVAGTRLTPAQRQKLAIARCLIKQPDILILSEATAMLDSSAQGRIMRNLLDAFDRRTLIWVLHQAKDAALFDHVLVMESGRVVESGPKEDVDREGSRYRQLVAAE